MQNKFDTFIKEQLNPEQQKAVLHDQGPLMVIAGAGSGKTRVITSRIAHLMINKEVPAEAIVALTFTNKAAREMQERIRHFLPKGSSVPFVGTFHSYCLRLLKQHPHLTKLSTFSIIDADDQQKIIKGILQRNNIGSPTAVKSLLYQISALKNAHSNPQAADDWHMHDQQLQQVYQAYEREKLASKCLDFDDLLHYGLRLFSDNGFKKQFQETVRHLLVDEYQDTNVIQHELLKAMALGQKRSCILDSICAVGDEDQSIYSWRGATVANMQHFKKDFSNTTTIKIEQNYRSAQAILDVANSVIKHNKQRSPKKLWSEKEGNNRVKNAQFMSEYQEGEAVAQLCKTVANKGTPIAVLYRTHFQSRAIEEALIRNSVPYRIFGGVQFYERKEIKDLLAYARLIVNPFDRPSFFRIINTPGRGLGPAFEALFYERWAQEPFLTFKDVAHKLIEEGAIKGKKQEQLVQFIAVYQGLENTTPPIDACKLLLERTGYIAHLKETYDLEDAQGRIDNLTELLRAIAHFASEGITSLEAFLAEIALMQEKSAKQDEEHTSVSLMTLHAAKGLEFDIVILVGLEEGLLPSARSLHDEEAIEEERRLFYVGITRARERLLLSHSRYRYSYGQMNDQLPSRFLQEIPIALSQPEDLRSLQPIELKQWMGQWFGVSTPSPVLTFNMAQKKPTVTPKVKRDTTPKKLVPQTGAWRTNQPVSHKIFGIGVVKKAEQKGDKTFVTVAFKIGTKKVLSTFLQHI